MLSPRIPTWLDAMWPSQRSMRRAIRYDGVIPTVRTEEGGPMTPENLRAIRAWIEEQRTGMVPIDIVLEGETPSDDRDAARAIVERWAEAGVTWWIEPVWTHFYRGTVETVRKRIAQGPPAGVIGGGG